MVTTELSAIQRNSVESARIASAVSDFLSRGGEIQRVGVIKLDLHPKRRDWIDPETVLKRKPPVMSRRDRNTLREMAERLA